jgi:hypothetical protein
MKYLDGKLSVTRMVVAAVLTVCAASAQTPAVKAVGTVKSVSGNSVVLTTDSGEQSVTFADSAHIVRAVPGQTDLKTATPIAVSDIQVGDRVLARGQAGEGNAVVASSAIVMKQSDIADKQQRERDEWRKGVGGIVKEVDASASTISIANAMIASGKPIVIHVSPETSIRRYAPDSVKFDDAKPGTFDQIKPGDQVRARGTTGANGTEFTAQAIISGAFRDIAGTVVSTDAANSTVTITDLATKKPLVVKVSADSQLRKLPPMVALGIAMRLKGGAPGVAGPGPPGQSRGQGSGNWNGGQGNWRGAGNADGSSAAAGGPAGSGAGASGTRGGAPSTSTGQSGGSGGQGAPGGNWRGGGGGAPDFQQMLSRMPAVRVSDLNKGDAVMLVATEGSSASGPTAITLLAGVEPILTAAPVGTSASTILSPWNLGTPAGAGGD